MNRIFGLLLLLIAYCGSLEASIDAPDHVIYGSATLFGNPAEPGRLIEARLSANAELLTAYQLGRDVRLGGQYALRIPMDAVNPRLEQVARPGDPIEIFMDGQLAARTVVGSIGTAVRLDIDPQALGSGPSITVDDVEVFEGNSGTTPMIFPARLNTTSGEFVALTWQTADDTAVGGDSCGPGVDFIHADGVLQFAPDSMTGSIEVTICANSEIQPTRRLRLQFTEVENGVLARGEVIGTIIDDDDIPDLRMADITVIRPVSGQSIAVFRPTLSKRSDYEVRFSYNTEALTAMEGTDFIAVSGQATIAADELETRIEVPVLSSNEATPPRDFQLRLGESFNVNFERDAALARISDARFDPAAGLVEEVDNDDVVSLAGPSALAIVEGGEQVYVSSEALSAVVLFDRNQLTGRLDWIETFDNEHPDLVGADLDGPLDVWLSPDGLNLYLASARNDSLIVLARDNTTGALSFHQRISGTSQEGLGGVGRLQVSADGRHVYATGSRSNALVVFARDASAGGTLTALQFESNCTVEPCTGQAVQMERPTGLVLSSDGESLYVASRFGNAVQAYARNSDPDSAEFGQLQLIAEYLGGLSGITDLEGALDLVLTPAGNQLYVSAEGENAVAMFDRADDGSLTQRQTTRHETPELPGLQGPQGLALSPSGDRLYATGFSDNTLTIFDRLVESIDDRLAGTLDVRQTLFDDQGEITAMSGPTRVVASEDDRHIYVVASTDNAIVVLRRLPVREDDDRIFRDDFLER